MSHRRTAENLARKYFHLLQKSIPIRPFAINLNRGHVRNAPRKKFLKFVDIFEVPEAIFGLSLQTGY